MTENSEDPASPRATPRRDFAVHLGMAYAIEKGLPDKFHFRDLVGLGRIGGKDSITFSHLFFFCWSYQNNCTAHYQYGTNYIYRLP